MIPKIFMKFLRTNFDDIDLIDIESEYDSTLNLAEQENIFIEKFRYFLKQSIKDRLDLTENRSDFLQAKHQEVQQQIVIEPEIEFYIDSLEEKEINLAKFDNQRTFKYPKKHRKLPFFLKKVPLNYKRHNLIKRRSHLR